MQNYTNVSSKLKSLKNSYIFHLILYIIIFIFHLIIYYKLFWLTRIIIDIFIFITYFGIIFLLFPIVPIYLICKNKFKIKAYNIFKNITFIFIFVSLDLGILSFATFFVNTKYSIKFNKECPFTYTLYHLKYTFNNYFGKNSRDKKLMNKCKRRRCIIYNTNLNEKYGFSYLCNYEANNIINGNNALYKRQLPNGTEVSSRTEIMCHLLNSDNIHNYFYNEILYEYIDTCLFSTNFYICYRLTEPEIYYILKNNEECPENNYLFILYIFSFIIGFLDILISSLVWCLEYSAYKIIIACIEINIIMQRRENNNNSLISTRNNTTKTNNNNPESFQKEQTVVIVIPLNEEKQENKRKINLKDNKTIKMDIGAASFGESDRNFLENRNTEIKRYKADEK